MEMLPSAASKLGLVFGLSLASFHADAQNVNLYPDSKIVLFSSGRGSNVVQCPEGSDRNAFNRLAAANGWYVKTRITGETRTGAGSSSEDTISKAEAVTLDKNEQRIRHWLLQTTINISRGPGSYVNMQCQTVATLQGEALNSPLQVDIGVRLIGRKVKLGEQVAPVVVLKPEYCGRGWQTTPKVYGDWKWEPFDCNSIGMSADTNKDYIYQTINLPEKE